MSLSSKNPQGNSTDKAISVAAKTLAKNVKDLNREIISELKADAPETTPNLNVRFGLSDHQLNETDYVNFLRGVMYGYLENERGFKAPETEPIKQQVIMEEQLYSNSRANGKSVPGQDYVWISFLPRQFIKNVEKAISQNLSGVNARPEVKKFLAGFPEFYSRQVKAKRSNYKSTVAHEITHLWLNQSSTLQNMVHKEHKKEVPEYEFIMEISGEGLSSRSQATRVGGNEYVSSIDEAVAFFITDHYGRTVRPSATLFSSYDNPEAIAWCLKILKEKAAEVEGSKVDYVRKLEMKVFEEIAQRGQIQQGGGYRNPLTVFLKHSLPETEKNRLSVFREVVEGDLADAFKDLKKAVSDIEDYERKTHETQALKDLKKLEEDIDWDNPKHIEDQLLHQVLHEAVGSYDLSEVHQEIQKRLSEEIQYLQKLVAILKKLDKDVGLEALDREIEVAGKEILSAEQKLEQIA